MLPVEALAAPHKHHCLVDDVLQKIVCELRFVEDQVVEQGILPLSEGVAMQHECHIKTYWLQGLMLGEPSRGIAKKTRRQTANYVQLRLLSKKELDENSGDVLKTDRRLVEFYKAMMKVPSPGRGDASNGIKNAVRTR